MIVMRKIFIAAALVLVAACTPKAKIGWVDSGVRYYRGECPEVISDGVQSLAAWKGETVSAEAFVWADEEICCVEAIAGDLKSSTGIIPADAITIGAVKYVISDTKKKFFGPAEERKAHFADSCFVYDVIDLVAAAEKPAGEGLPFWVTVTVPRDAAAGEYTGFVTIKGKGIGKTKLPLTLTVVDRTLPEPSEWPFHLDLWQNPYAVARMDGVELWSEAHFNSLRRTLTPLANAGQKVITATLVDKPWNGQTEDPFQSMVSKTLKKDKTWAYDYSIFDKWVEFMMSLGIKEQINCYSMLKWGLKMDYFDEASGQTIILETTADSKEFEWYWGPFLTDFKQHLAQKGWLDITSLAMDERPKKDMDAAFKVINKYAPGMKVSLAGWPKDANVDAIYDLCIAYDYDITEAEKANRKNLGLVNTFYTCCSPEYPNTFAVSQPAESSWMGWYATARGLDGYLRWAFCSWNKDPMTDTRFRGWMAADCFFVYPEGRNSVRFSKLVEGIQASEKINVLRQNATPEMNAKIDEILSAINRPALDESRGAACVQIIPAVVAKLNEL